MIMIARLRARMRVCLCMRELQCTCVTCVRTFPARTRDKAYATKGHNTAGNRVPSEHRARDCWRRLDRGISSLDLGHASGWDLCRVNFNF